MVQTRSGLTPQIKKTRRLLSGGERDQCGEMCSHRASTQRKRENWHKVWVPTARSKRQRHATPATKLAVVIEPVKTHCLCGDLQILLFKVSECSEATSANTSGLPTAQSRIPSPTSTLKSFSRQHYIAKSTKSALEKGTAPADLTFDQEALRFQVSRFLDLTEPQFGAQALSKHADLRIGTSQCLCGKNEIP